MYEIGEVPYQNTFYNGTIEVTEAGGLVSVETVFLVSLGFALLVLLGLWVRGQLQNLSKVINSVNFLIRKSQKVNLFFFFFWFRKLRG